MTISPNGVFKPMLRHVFAFMDGKDISKRSAREGTLLFSCNRDENCLLKVFHEAAVCLEMR